MQGCTDEPDRFMYVVGFSSTVACPPTFVCENSPLNLAVDRGAPQRCASRSTTMNPMLWRVASYSFPGLPRPTTSHIERHSKGSGIVDDDYFFFSSFLASGAAAAPAAGAAPPAAGAAAPSAGVAAASSL